MSKSFVEVALAGFSERDIWKGAVAGFLIVLAICSAQLFSLSEYEELYAGARLAGTPFLYDVSMNQGEQIRAIGAALGEDGRLTFPRLPFEAALLYPLGRLPYRISLVVFQLLSLAALAGFVLLWPFNRPSLTVLACAWSLPLLLNFMFVEDDVFLLLLVSLVFRLYPRRPAQTGVLMSLFAVKFHLFLLLPLLFLAQRRWRMGLGFAAGGAALTGISFLVAGPAWPIQLAEIIQTDKISREYSMPNVHGLLQAVASSIVPEVLISLALAGVVWWILRRADFTWGMMAVLVGGLLVSHHAGAYDCILLIPVLLYLAGQKLRYRYEAFLVLSLFSPIPYWLMVEGKISAPIGIVFVMSLLGVVALEVAPYRVRSAAV